MRTSDILNVQVVNYISTQVRALKIYSGLLGDVNQASGASFEQIRVHRLWPDLASPTGFEPVLPP